jgi:hypothetical protein
MLLQHYSLLVQAPKEPSQSGRHVGHGVTQRNGAVRHAPADSAQTCEPLHSLQLAAQEVSPQLQVVPAPLALARQIPAPPGPQEVPGVQPWQVPLLVQIPLQH